jgi:hypothetical protein
MSTACPHAAALDAQTPGGVYLCQVSESVSCAACCGLYNLADCSREYLECMLRVRTLRFAGVARTVDAIEGFGYESLRLEPQQRPFEGFHHCPFIGWIGSETGRVGCLLHPLAAGNNDVDYRGLSYYGGLACRSYFCPATHELPPRFKQIVRTAADDWYSYGLVITEKELLISLLEQIENRLGQPLEGEMFTQTLARQALLNLFYLKIEWPFRPTRWDTPCHYFFKENPRPKPPINYNRIGVEVSRFDPILRELISEFATPDRLRQAEQMIDLRLDTVLRELSGMLPKEGL